MNKKDIYINAGWVKALIALLLLACTSGFAQAQTVPSKPQDASKQSQPAAKQAKPVPKPAPAESKQVQAAPKIPPFDHARTGFLLRDIHTTLRCEQCHVDGVFKNTPKECAGCHSIGSRVAATPKPINHVQTTSACDTCHSSPTTFMVASFKHVGINSGCTSCHNGQSLGVVSKPANHFPTLMPCENCHNTTTFAAARMDHTGITSGCASCHMGQFAGVVSKPVTHINVGSADCAVCHNTVSFSGARFDHSGVAAGSCDTCHMGQFAGVVPKPALHIATGTAKCDVCHTAANTNGYTSFLGGNYNHVSPGVGAPSAPNNCSTCHTGQFPGVLGKPPFHITTSLQCDSCHTNYISFLGATYTHTAPIGVCATCHNGVSARGKAIYHVPTTAACDTCHTQINTANYTTFLGALFTHPTPITARCDSCHNGTTAKGKMPTHVVTSSDCVLCHTQANTANYTTFLGATFVHATPPGVCSTCHNGVTAKGKPTWHMVTTSACDSCHTQVNTNNYTTFLGATGMIDHSTIPAGNCQSCHNGAAAKGQQAGHIPTGSNSCDAGGCHQKYNGTTVLTFASGVMNHSLFPATRCYTCHNGSYTSQGPLGAQAMAINHIPLAITGGTGGLECTTCHRTPVYTSATGWASVTMNHNNAQGGGPVYCVTCHLTGNSYVGAMRKFSHNGASVAKDCSSASCHKPKGGVGAAYTNWTL